MKIHLASAAGQNLFSGYGDGYVLVNQQRFDKNVIVMPDQIIENWDAIDFETLTAAHFTFILKLQPEIVLLGTGEILRFPPPRLTQPLIDAGIGLESMSTGAACRTYNILMAEGRKVAAALLLA